ncbi:MAG: HAD family hydrolase [Chlorobiaceae bacterium]|nr:HAD family hydrolase [Chlorobiaceae bacterium]NTV60434.1 HAD family hydrolase [Chlorobiaceae bacterium]
MKYRLLVFDFDGTLADSEASILETLNLVARDLGLSGVDRSSARRGIGLPLIRTIEMGLGLEPDRAAGAVELYRTHYNEVAFHSTSLFPGVKETLNLLREDYLLAIASNKSRQGLYDMMRHLGIYEWFSFIAGAQDVQQAKPAPDMVLIAMEALDIHAGECLVVGDTVYDIEMGQRASADTCAVTYGINSEDELRILNPTFVIDSFVRLLSCLT